MGAKLGLNANYIRELFNIIHEESVRNQTRIMRENKKRKNELSKSVPMTKKVEKTKSRRGYFWQPAF